MNCTGGQPLVTSNILSFSQSHDIACIMLSLSMARNVNCALRLLSPPVPKSGGLLQIQAMQEPALQTWGIFDSGGITLLLFALYYSSLKQIL